MKCRFTGHSERFYSVAEHSVRVAHLARARAMEMLPESYFAKGDPYDNATVKMAFAAGLMHDAGEAYIPDVAGPIKKFVFFQFPGVGVDHSTSIFDIERNINIAISCAVAPALGQRGRTPVRQAGDVTRREPAKGN